MFGLGGLVTFVVSLHYGGEYKEMRRPTRHSIYRASASHERRLLGEMISSQEELRTRSNLKMCNNHFTLFKRLEAQ